ncbi:MAG: 3-oxoacyl-ACP synthase III [Thermodesulfobacteriota bacterium]|nr:3-oxoacyl-ACP synthase III [Thermodesulfobacteriota bacterium]
MKYKKVCIEAFGYEIPDNIVKSSQIEERLSSLYERFNLHHGRLEMMTGIKERRFFNNGTKPSDASIKASEKAMAKAGIKREDVDFLLHCSVCRDFLEPATATTVHKSLKLPSKTGIFDISNACLGFLNGMVTLANMIELEQIKTGIVVATETSEILIEKTIKDLLEDKSMTKTKLRLYMASLTLGSGAAAVILTHSSISRTGHKLLGGSSRTASQHNGLCRVVPDACFYSNNHPAMQTNAEELIKNGHLLALDTWEATKKELGWSNEDVDKVSCHQIGATQRKPLLDLLGLDLSKDFSTAHYLGNIGSVSLPITFAIGVEEGFIEQSDKVAMLGIGSGLVCLMLGVEW